MKIGYRHNTAIFGTDAENYVGRLFWMYNNPNGSRRPDLISINGRYNPKLSVEVKSGINGKIPLVSNQLHYGISTHLDYELLFEESFKFGESLLPGFEGFNPSNLAEGEVAYYYDVVSRNEEVKSDDLNKPFGILRVKWLDQVLVPHDLVFESFAIARHIRTGEPLGKIKTSLKEQMKKNVDEQSSHYSENREKKDWQNFYLRDMLALYHRDDFHATEGGRERIAILRDNYDTKSLRRILIPGPNGTNIYVLAHDKQKDLFDRQLRRTVEQRMPHVERVSRSRDRISGLLAKIKLQNISQGTLNGKREVKKIYSTKRLNDNELARLERLKFWADRGEPLVIIPDYNSKMDGCSDAVDLESEECQYIEPANDDVAPF